MMKDNKNNIETFLTSLYNKDIELILENKNLRIKAPKGSLTEKDKEQLINYKQDIIELLKSENNLVLIHDKENLYEKFSLTDIQEAYLLGRGSGLEYGNVSCHICLELLTDHIDKEKAERAWDYLIDRHAMLRAIFTKDNQQIILKEVPFFSISEQDLTKLADEDVEKELEILRKKLGHRKYNLLQWPLFDVKITHLRHQDIMHLSIEFLIADWSSIQLLLKEFCEIYDKKKINLPELSINFKDYISYYKKRKESFQYLKDKQYWEGRIEDFPGAPELPYMMENTSDGKFERYNFNLGLEKWEKFIEVCRKTQVTPTVMLMSFYAAVLSLWSTEKRFCINMTTLVRPNIHPDINNIVGDFTSTSLVEINWNNEKNFADNIKAVQFRLAEDLSHNLYSGVKFIRAMKKYKNGENFLMPIVFTSAINAGKNENMSNCNISFAIGENGISQTPQVFIDCQVINDKEGLHINWDYRKDVFESSVIKDMFDTFCDSILKTVIDDTFLKRQAELMIPKHQRDRRKRINSVKYEYCDLSLHSRVYKISDLEKTAIETDNSTISYREVIEISNNISGFLRKQGCKVGDRIAILAEKSDKQIEAALGIMKIGGVYIPIGINQPYQRVAQILQEADVKKVLISRNQIENFKGIGDYACLEDIQHYDYKEEISVSTDRIAYIIFTSGTTGIPKGVEISHKSAMNTILDVERLINFSKEDRVLGVSKFNFDLSVFDTFAALGNGANIVLPDESKINDPSYIEKLMREKEITVWNSVPALMVMLVDYIEAKEIKGPYKLKKVLLSGDWIPVDLPKRIYKIFGNVQIICLGGATECSIWSNYFEYYPEMVKKKWASIPYGKPLSNQQFYVLDNKKSECPDFVQENYT